MVKPKIDSVIYRQIESTNPNEGIVKIVERYDPVEIRYLKIGGGEYGDYETYVMTEEKFQNLRSLDGFEFLGAAGKSRITGLIDKCFNRSHIYPAEIIVTSPQMGNNWGILLKE